MSVLNSHNCITVLVPTFAIVGMVRCLVLVWIQAVIFGVWNGHNCITVLVPTFATVGMVRCWVLVRVPGREMGVWNGHNCITVLVPTFAILAWSDHQMLGFSACPRRCDGCLEWPQLHNSFGLASYQAA